MSTLQTYPLCHTLQLHSNLNIYIKALNFFPSQRSICCRELLGLKASPSSIRFVGSYDINFFRYKRYFFAAFGAFTIVSLNYLVWRFQFWAFVENKTAFFANYLLRHGLTAVVDRNTNVTSYLYITTKREKLVRVASIFCWEHQRNLSWTSFFVQSPENQFVCRWWCCLSVNRKWLLLVNHL